MLVTTGMLILGKMSTGIVTIASTPITAMSSDMTTKVYGRLSASLTIHMSGRYWQGRCPAIGQESAVFLSSSLRTGGHVWDTHLRTGDGRHPEPHVRGRVEV